MKTLRFILLFVLAGMFSCSNPVNKNVCSSKLWYDKPAGKWVEALPLGNGRLGAMVYGHPGEEHIQLNSDAMWPGDNGWGEPAGRPADLAKIRKLVMQGKNEEADALLIEKFSNKSVVRSHQTLGDLWIGLNHDSITDYRRELDLNSAIAYVSYKANGHQVNEKVFVSHPARAIVIELSTNDKKGLSGMIRLTRPHDNGHPTVSVKTEEVATLIMDGEVTQYGGKVDSKPDPVKKGVKFQSRLKVKNSDGQVIAHNEALELKGVTKAVIYLVSNNSYYHSDYETVSENDLKAVIDKDVVELEKAHVKDYQSLFNRVELNLGDYPCLDSIPTDKRLERIKNDSVDVGMEELLFHYGRYLLIASSREGTLPANLQGLWNNHIEAPWNADYHLNINLQMNYWLANATNLDDLNNPLFDYLDLLVENGKKTARINFGCRGAFFPHATDIWGSTWLRAPTAYWGGSFGAGGWMAQHYWQHFEYTRDTAFLRQRAFPAIKEIAQFYSDWLVEDPRDGMLVSVPSTSPENRYVNASGKKVASCMGSAMDQQIIAEVFDEYIKVCGCLGVDNDLLKVITEQNGRLRPGFIIGSDGRILEWDREYEEVEPGHRHMSHLYGFHPGVAVNQDNHPELWDAIQKTLQYRLDHGGAGTGWSRAWLINLSARLKKGEMAHEHIRLLLKKSMFKNLFDAHPPFQIDGNFGYTAGVAEMLVQSHAGYIDLLPALPKVYANGSFKGLKVRGNAQVSASWQDMKLQKTCIKAVKGGVFKLKIPQGAKCVKASLGGKSVDLKTKNGLAEIALEPLEEVELTFVY